MKYSNKVIISNNLLFFFIGLLCYLSILFFSKLIFKNNDFLSIISIVPFLVFLLSFPIFFKYKIKLDFLLLAFLSSSIAGGIDLIKNDLYISLLTFLRMLAYLMIMYLAQNKTMCKYLLYLFSGIYVTYALKSVSIIYIEHINFSILSKYDLANVAVLAGLAILFAQEKSKLFYLCILAIIPLFFFTIAYGARGYMLALLLGLIGYLFIRNDFNVINKPTAAFLFACILPFILFYFIDYSDVVMYLHLYKLDTSSNVDRIAQIYISINDFIENPFFGTGAEFSHSSQYFDLYQELDLSLTISNTDAHHIFLEMLGNYGIFVSTLFIFTHILFFKRFQIKSTTIKLVQIYILVSFIVMFVVSPFGSTTRIDLIVMLLIYAYSYHIQTRILSQRSLDPIKT